MNYRMGHRSARWTLRYWTLAAIYRRMGLVDVPLIGPRADGKRDCSPGFQAQIDVLGVMTINDGSSVCRRTVYMP